MADPTNPTGPRGVNIPRVTVQNAEVRNATIQRTSVGRGTEQTGETDLLKEVRETIQKSGEDTTREIHSLADILNRIAFMIGQIKKTSDESNASMGLVEEGMDSLTDVIRQLNKTLSVRETGDSDVLKSIDKNIKKLLGGGGGRIGGGGGVAAGGPTMPGGGDDGFSKSFSLLQKQVESLTAALAGMAERVAGGLGGGDGGGGESKSKPSRDNIENASLSTTARRLGEAEVSKKARDAAEKITGKMVNEMMGPGRSGINFRKLWAGVDSTTKKRNEQLRISIVQDFIDSVAKARTVMSDFSRMVGSVNANVVRTIRETSEYGVGSGTLTYGGAIIDNFTSMFRQFGLPLIDARDNLIETMRTLRDAMNENMVSPMLLMGTSLAGTAAQFNQARSRASSLMSGGASDLYNNLNWRQQNMLFAQSLEGSRLMGSSTRSLSDPDVQRMTRRNFETLQMIAANTGMTVDELRKLTKEGEEDIRAAVGIGIGGGAEAENIIEAYRASIGRGDKNMAAAILEYAKAGGSQGGGLDVIAGNEGLARLQAMGFDFNQAFMNISSRGNRGLEESMAEMRRTLGQNRDAFGPQGVALAKSVGEGFGFLKEILKTGDVQMNQRAENDPLARIGNRLVEIFDNSGIFKDAILAMGSLVGALWANTLALTLTGSKLGSMIGGGIKGAFSRLAGGVGAAAGVAGNLANSGARSVGSLLGRAASGGMGLPVVGGLVAGGVTAATGGGLWESIMTGVGSTLGAIGGGALGTLAGGFGAIPGAIAGGWGGAELGGSIGKWIDGMVGPESSNMSATVGQIGDDAKADHEQTLGRFDEMIGLLRTQNTMLQRQIEIGEAGLGGGGNRDIAAPPMQTPYYGYGPARTTIGGPAGGRS